MEQDGLGKRGVRICWGDDETAVLGRCWARYTSFKGGSKEETGEKGIVADYKWQQRMWLIPMRDRRCRRTHQRNPTFTKDWILLGC